MPAPEFPKGTSRVVTQTVSSPTFSTGQVSVDVADLVEVEDVVSVQGDMASGVTGLSLDAYSIDGNTVTLDLETDDGTIGDAIDADVDELIVTARGY